MRREMLPDFPETKRLFDRFFHARMRRKIRELSPFGMINTRHYHEGRGMKVTRPDSQSKSELEQFTTETQISVEEIENLTFLKAIEKYDAMILDMVRQQTGFVMRRMSQEIPDSQSVSAKGRKLDAELVLETLEKIQIEFNPDGTPHQIHVVGPLFTADAMRSVDQEFANSPELQKRHEELMNRKREEWRAREANRKLVR
jgi:hypothetical protein